MTQKRFHRHFATKGLLVLSDLGTVGFDMHDRSSGYKCHQGTLVVRQCLSAWQYVRQVTV